MKGTTTARSSRGASFSRALRRSAAWRSRPPLPAQITTMAPFEKLPPYGNNTLPAGVRPRLVPNVNGLTVNMIEAGTQGRPLVLLLHGFPNLGYSWRKVMPAFADAGYYVIAPDCRGFGRTVGWDKSWDADPTPFLTLNMVRDQIALVYALGYRKAEMIVGHDQGQLIATYAAIVRPDMFLRLTTVSSAGGAPPSFPFAGTERKPAYTAAELDAEFAKLNPPRRDYQDYWASKQADEDMKHMPQSMSDFFRAFYYMKGGEFPGNQNLTPLAADADRERGRGRECAHAGILRDETGPGDAGHDGRVHAVEGVHRQLQVVHAGGVRCLRAGICGLRLDRRPAQLSAPAHCVSRQTSPSNSPSRGGPSMSPRSSSRANRTGAPTGSREALEGPGRTASRNSRACSWWIAPAIGLRRSSPRS